MAVLLLFFTFLLGASLGSFLAATLLRIKGKESLAGRSHCDNCQKQLRVRDNVPIFSWLFLRARSSCCREKISSFYFIVELASALFLTLIVALIIL